ncbi:SCO family protein [Acuticoccus sp. I52.16.1]|uniref:SCO family protein n=1 Tax=Acuticoccus sp. I52.16.1 TaxID=2928472 RepID=UPI001FD5D3E8|nr:SCO family protein [Acuticoccus sp. I52.16.1]UOM33324.1 SCO family protein [Acuticoccus sp. I52.16.1]
MRTIRLVLWGLVLVVGAVVAGVTVGRLLTDEPVVASGSLGAAQQRAKYENAGGPFDAVDTKGEPVSAADLEGKPRAMFFGFTHCPDVCPTAMLEAQQWLDALGPKAGDINIVFVTVDPERDTPEILDQYIGAFDERIIGLVPTSEQALAAMAEGYGIVYNKVPLGEGDYTMNHTADTLLFDADGTYAGFIPFTPFSARQSEELTAQATNKAVEQLKDLVGG